MGSENYPSSHWAWNVTPTVPDEALESLIRRALEKSKVSNRALELIHGRLTGMDCPAPAEPEPNIPLFQAAVMLVATVGAIEDELVALQRELFGDA